MNVIAQLEYELTHYDPTVNRRDSGMVIDWSHMNFDGPIVDKHSTGGVGDVTSLMTSILLLR